MSCTVVYYVILNISISEYSVFRLVAELKK